MYLPEHLDHMFNESNITSFLMYEAFDDLLEQSYDRGEDALLDELKYSGVSSIVDKYMKNYLPEHTLAFLGRFLADEGFIEWLDQKENEEDWSEARI
jgi:hypothetical protein